MTTVKDPSIERAGQRMVEAAGLLFATGVMQASGHGNLSCRLGDDRMLLTGSGSIRGLRPDQLVVVTFDGQVIEGEMDATNAEIVAMHAGVYRARSSAGAVIHTHSPNATSFALAHLPLPCAYEGLLRMGLAEPVPVAAWGPRGSEASVRNIVDQLQAHPAVTAVLLANHGLLAFADDPVAAARLVIAMEEAATMTLGARHLGGEQGFPTDALAREREHMARFGSRA